MTDDPINNSAHDQAQGTPTPPAYNNPYTQYYAHIAADSQPTVPKKPARYTKWESIGAMLVYVLSYFLCRACIDGGYLGMSIVCVLTLALTVSCLIIKKAADSPISAYLFLCYSVLFATVPLFSSNSILNLAAYPAFFLCIVLFLFFVRKGGTGRASAEYVMYDSASALFVQPFTSGKNIFSALIHPLRAGRLKKAGKPLLYILVGIGAAVIPFIFVLSNLSFDSNFTRLLNDILPTFSLKSIGTFLICVIYAVPLSMYFFSSAAGTSAKTPDGESSIALCKKYDESKVYFRFIPSLTLLTAAIPLLFLYAVFFISQIDSYTAAFSSTLPEGFIYSEYARSGFFELCRVAGLNALVILASVLLSRRKDGKAPILPRLISVIFSLCSLVLIATALAKMILYIDAYGMTAKRVYVAFFMILMAVGFILCILAQFVRRLKMTWVCLTLSVLFITIPAICGFDSMIHSYNVDRYIDGTLNSVDYSVMYDRSALPALERLYFSGTATPLDKTNIERIAHAMSPRHAERGIFDRNIANLRADASSNRILDAKTAEKE